MMLDTVRRCLTTTLDAVRRRARRHAALLALPMAFAAIANGQNENPVYVDDSPRAWELFLRASDQSDANPAEAVRLFQELLDEYGLKLAPAAGTNEHLTSVRHRVLEHLRSHPELLDRYRIIESAPAQRLLEGGELRRLAMTRSLTAPGLQALLRLAQQGIESARFDAAGRWLDETVDHPDLDATSAAHALYMTGLAAHYRGDASRLAEALAALETMDAVDGLDERLRKLRAHVERPSIDVGISPMDRTRTEDLSDLVAEEIWSVPLNDSLLSRRFSGLDRQQHPTRDQHRRAGDLMTAAATVAGNTVYVNQGHSILALDRFTGRERWVYLDRHRLAAASPDTDQALDMNFVTVNGGSLVTLTGHASADERSADGKVLCLETSDGALRWSRSLDRIGNVDDHEGLFPHGQPIIAESVVYVLARKVTKQYLTTCYLVALDLADGDLLWARHLASSGGLRRSARALSTLLYDRGDLYVSTAVGAIARVAADRGEIRWLRRYNVPISPRYNDENRRPWELPTPVVIDDSVVALQPGQRRVVVLDRETGHELAGHAADTQVWNSPRYLLANEHSVYAIGSEVRAFRIENLMLPAWRMPQPAQTIDGRPDVAGGEEIEIRGRVQLAQGALIIPTLGGVLVVDDETGRVMHELPVQSVGTPVATDAQLLLAGSDSLDSFMSFRRAERMLRQRIVANPKDPEPSLSLLRLGSRARRLDLALDAADQALRTIEPGTSANARQELFNLLLEMDAERVAQTIDEGRALHAMIDVVAIEPDQRVEHLLAYGRWLSTHDLGEAVEQYQEVLSDPELATLRRAEQGLVNDAGYWAARRLGALIDQHGPTVYAPQADYAQLRLQRLGRETQGDPERLRALAREFPFAEAGIEAAARAASMLLQRGDHAAALATLLDSYRLAPGPTTTRRLLGRAVDLCVQRGWTIVAADLLEHVDRVGGVERLETFDGERPRAAWATVLGAGRPARPTPRLGDAQEGFGLDARLLPLEPWTDVSRPVDAVLLMEDRTLVRLDAPGLDERWQRPLDDAGAELLAAADGRILLWLDADAADPRGIMLDGSTGQPIWSTPPIGPLVGDPVRELTQQRGIREQMPDGAPFDPTEALPRIRSGRLLVVQRSGGSVMFDLSDVGDPIWHARNPLEEVHLAAMHEFGIALAGRQRRIDATSGAPTTPRLVLLDPDTGAVRSQIRPFGGSGVRWMVVGPLGSLVYATSEGIESIDLASGVKRWTNLDYAALDTRNAWLAGERVVVEDNDGHLRAIAMADGRMSDQFDLPPRGEWDQLELLDVTVVDDRIYAQYRQRLVAYDLQGEIVGADVITDDRDYRALLPTADGLLLLSRHTTEHVRVGDQGARQTQYTYRIYELSRNCKVQRQLELPPITAPFLDAAVVNGGLVLSTQEKSVFVPMPAGGN